MNLSRSGVPTCVVLAFALAGGAACLPRPSAADDDALARALRRWTVFASDTTGAGELTRSVRAGSVHTLQRAESDLAAGRRWAALHRLAAVYADLAGAAYMDSLPPATLSDAGFEAEWKRVQGVLAREHALHAAPAGIGPVAALAEAEAALPQARILHEASLEYGRNTEPQYGLFYIGSALAEREFAALCRSLATPDAGHAPPLRSIRPEIDELQGKLLAAYRPPASVDRHAEFIGASSALKEARALDAAGYHRGALLRYLMGAARSAPLIDSSAASSAPELAARLDAFAARLDAGGADHSIARIFLELARSELEAAPGTSPPLAVSIANEVLPRYFAALRPRAQRPSARPEVDVTLVRWPFT